MKNENSGVDVLREYQLFLRREHTQPHMSYAHEKERHRVITAGQIDQLEEVLNIPPDGTQGILSKNELRNDKNMFISAITLFTRAAMDGGLPEEIAYAMSDSYIQNAEKFTTPGEIEELYYRALREFTCAVAEKGKNYYSIRIEQAVHYIHIHLHEEITLERAAEDIGISACYLSRLFRKETGESLVEYVQKERVEAARHMLIYSEYTSAEISEYLHFSTQSYFIKIFQKHIGMTPYEYRNYYRKEVGW